MTAEQYLYARKWLCRTHRDFFHSRYVSGCEECPLFCKRYRLGGTSCIEQLAGYADGKPETDIVGIVEKWWNDFISNPKNLELRKKDDTFLAIFPQYAVSDGCVKGEYDGEK